MSQYQGMEITAIIFGVIGALTGIGGLMIAVRGDKRATRAEGNAKSSAKSAQRSADASEDAVAELKRANDIAESQAQPTDAKLSDAIWVSGNLFQIKNETGRHIVIEQALASPSEHQRLLRPKHDLPQSLSPNETFEFFSEERAAAPRPDIVLVWRWSDENRFRETRRMVAARP